MHKDNTKQLNISRHGENYFIPDENNTKYLNKQRSAACDKCSVYYFHPPVPGSSKIAEGFIEMIRIHQIGLQKSITCFHFSAKSNSLIAAINDSQTAN